MVLKLILNNCRYMLKKKYPHHSKFVSFLKLKIAVLAWSLNPSLTLSCELVPNPSIFSFSCDPYPYMLALETLSLKEWMAGCGFAAQWEAHQCDGRAILLAAALPCSLACTHILSLRVEDARIPRAVNHPLKPFLFYFVILCLSLYWTRRAQRKAQRARSLSLSLTRTH